MIWRRLSSWCGCPMTFECGRGREWLCRAKIKNRTPKGCRPLFLIEGTLHMSVHTFRTLQSLCLFSVILATQSTVSAEEPSQSLYETRLSINKGTSTGIVIYKFQQPAASAPTNAKSEAVTNPSAESVPQAPFKSGFLSALQPPSGRSLSTANRLGAVDGGIPVSTAHTASESKAVR